MFALCFASRLIFLIFLLFFFHLSPVFPSSPATVGKYSFEFESISSLIIREVCVKGKGHKRLCTCVEYEVRQGKAQLCARKLGLSQISPTWAGSTGDQPRRAMNSSSEVTAF